MVMNNFIIDSCPGTGKSTTLETILKDQPQFLLLLFNRNLALRYHQTNDRCFHQKNTRTVDSFVFEILDHCNSLPDVFKQNKSDLNEKDFESLLDTYWKLKKTNLDILQNHIITWCNYTSIIIDEYQDMKIKQKKIIADIIKILYKNFTEKPFVILAGDSCQQIYGYLNKNRRVIENNFSSIKKDFPGIEFERIELRKCHRIKNQTQLKLLNIISRTINPSTPNVYEITEENQVTDLDVYHDKIDMYLFANHKEEHQKIIEMYEAERSESKIIIYRESRYFQATSEFKKLKDIRFTVSEYNLIRTLNFDLDVNNVFSVFKLHKTKTFKEYSIILENLVTIENTFNEIIPQLSDSIKKEKMLKDKLKNILEEYKKIPHFSSIHKAKGLEFDVVFFVGFNVDDYQNEDLQLLYVGLSRNRNRLVMSTPRKHQKENIQTMFQDTIRLIETDSKIFINKPLLRLNKDMDFTEENLAKSKLDFITFSIKNDHVPYFVRIKHNIGEKQNYKFSELIKSDFGDFVIEYLSAHQTYYFKFSDIKLYQKNGCNDHEVVFNCINIIQNYFNYELDLNEINISEMHLNEYYFFENAEMRAETLKKTVLKLVNSSRIKTASKFNNDETKNYLKTQLVRNEEELKNIDYTNIEYTLYFDYGARRGGENGKMKDINNDFRVAIYDANNKTNMNKLMIKNSFKTEYKIKTEKYKSILSKVGSDHFLRKKGNEKHKLKANELLNNTDELIEAFLEGIKKSLVIDEGEDKNKDE